MSNNVFSLMRSDFQFYHKPGKGVLGKLGALIYTLLEPGLWAIMTYRISHSLFKMRLKHLSVFISRWNKLWHHVDIHPQAVIGRHVRFPHCIDIVIGSTAVIEDEVEILNGVTLGASNLRSEEKQQRHPTIKRNVFIGSGAKIIGSITIGENAKIGANSVVLMDIPDHATAVGIPARIIQK